MKNTSLLLSILLLASFGYGQTTDVESNLSITGIAISKVLPDSYTLIFTLEEFSEEDDRGCRKIKSLEAILEELKSKLKEFGISDSKPMLINVTSINQNPYGTGNQLFLRKSYGVSDSLIQVKDILKIVENLRFKGLSGILVRGDFTAPTDLEVAICSKALDDAELKADAAFAKLNLKKGRILDVDINNREFNFDRNNYNDYNNNSYYGQYGFSMIPSMLQCSVDVEYAIVRE